jgi:hypothetical protein
MIKEPKLYYKAHPNHHSSYFYHNVIDTSTEFPVPVFNSLFGQIPLNSDFYIFIFNLKNTESIKPKVVLSQQMTSVW